MGKRRRPWGLQWLKRTWQTISGRTQKIRRRMAGESAKGDRAVCSFDRSADTPQDSRSE